LPLSEQSESAPVLPSGIGSDVLRIAGEHAGELADVLRATRQVQRADLLDEFADALLEAADSRSYCAEDWATLLDDLGRREAVGRGDRDAA
jgi:hypothetical protein